MDRSSGNGSLVNNLPYSLVNRVNIDLISDESVIKTFKDIERLHWDYLDNYRDINRRKYPTLNIYQFSRKLFNDQNVDTSIKDIEAYIRQYNRYKKSIPTAGVIFYHNNDNGVDFIVIKMRYAKIWSMPKGKKDPDDINLMTTAHREFKEETGLDVEDCLNKELPSKNICKTCFYVLESDVRTRYFNGYNTKEIDSVKWVSIKAVISAPDYYSKQVQLTARYLQDLLHI
jgi:8-oxo-dGTP pyrophosphatase MutT (NUDIX family)